MRLTMVWGVVAVAASGGVAPGAHALGQTAPGYTVFAGMPRGDGEQQEPRVSLELKDVTVQRALDQIAAQAKLALMWNHARIPLGEKISVSLHNVTVQEALTTVLRGTGAEGRLSSDGQAILVVLAKDADRNGGVRAGGVIAGRVTDSTTGEGLNGAQVRVEGTKLSVVTSDSGHFTMRNVPPGDQVLQVRLFGYRPAMRTVTVVDNERTTVRIAMASVPTVLSGVVTTATGLQRKVEVGNDITTINVDSVMQVAPITSVTDLLETRVPGLTVLHTSGVPGDPARLRLRGAGSITETNDPIVIIDGIRVYANQSDARNNNMAPTHTGGNTSSQNVAGKGPAYAAPSPVDQIDPNSIETIEVFKGPSASALYGSDAASGVIVITTKHGRAGPTHWNLALGQGANWLPGSWPVNYYRFGYDEYKNQGPLCMWNDLGCQVDSLVTYQALNDPRYSVFSHGSDQTASLTVSGGMPTLQYSLSGSAAGDVGNLKLPGIEVQRYETFYGPMPGWMRRPDNYQTWGINGSLTAQPTPTTRVSLTSSLFNSNQQRSSLEGAIPQLEGGYIFPALLGTTPLIQNDVERATSGSLASTNAVTVTWQPYAWLPLDATGGLNAIQRTDNSYIPFGVNSSGSAINGGDTTGSYGLGRGTSRDATLTAGTAMPLLRQHLTLAIGGNVYSQSTADFTAYTDQLAPGVSTPTSFPTTGCGQSTCPSFFGQSVASANTYGWYMEPRLNISSRFFAAPGFRLDGGSGGTHASYNTGSIGGLSAFPKIDLSWIAVDRQSAPPLWGVLTLLRPRVAFGYAGTQPGLADRLRLFNVGSSNSQYDLQPGGQGKLTNNGGECQPTLTLDGSTYVQAVCINALGNTQLRPERSSELEGGLDATLWQGRLTLTYTQYNKTRHDAILVIPVAPSVSGRGVGGTNIEKNIGVIRNTGTELTVNAFVLESRALSWNVGANLSNNNSLLVRLNPGQQPFCMSGTLTQGGSCLVAGYPLFSEWAQPIVSFVDANHNTIIEPSEIRLADSAVYVGQPNPKYQVNLTSDVTMLNGRLSVHATFAYQNGLTQTNTGSVFSGGFALLPNTPNTSLATQAAVVAATELGTPTNIGLIQTVNTFRFSDLSINYEVPKALSSLFRVPRMTLALQGSNLALHTNYRGKDPSVNAFSTVSAGDEAADTGQIPEPRAWWLKLSVGN